jgi:hypothetical protein
MPEIILKGGLASPVKLESRYMTYTVLVQHKTKPKKQGKKTGTQKQAE